MKLIFKSIALATILFAASGTVEAKQVRHKYHASYNQQSRSCKITMHLYSSRSEFKNCLITLKD